MFYYTYAVNIRVYEVCIGVESAFVRTTKLTPLHNFSHNIAQNILHINNTHTFLKTSHFQPRQFNRDSVLMQKGITRF
jgi:hypothetical protein